MVDVLHIHPSDNVCVAVRPLPAGMDIRCGEVEFTLDKPVPLGAKLSLATLDAGEKIVKFGEPIGSLTRAVRVGEYIHTHNLESDYLRTYERGELLSTSQGSAQ
jgi:hypothetical protein